MSQMEFFHGTFETSDLDIKVEDTDEFYDIEKAHGCFYVRVNGQLYVIRGGAINLAGHGFATVIGPTTSPQLFLYWYNGGAGIHEVAEDTIKRYLGAQN